MEVDFLYNYNPWWESGYKFDELKERTIVKRLIIEIENKSIIMKTASLVGARSFFLCPEMQGQFRHIRYSCGVIS